MEFSRLYSIQFYQYTTIYLLILLLVAVWVASSFFAVLNNAVMNIYGHVSFCTCGCFFRIHGVTDEWN